MRAPRARNLASAVLTVSWFIIGCKIAVAFLTVAGDWFAHDRIMSYVRCPKRIRKWLSGYVTITPRRRFEQCSIWLYITHSACKICKNIHIIICFCLSNAGRFTWWSKVKISILPIFKYIFIYFTKRLTLAKTLSPNDCIWSMYDASPVSKPYFNSSCHMHIYKYHWYGYFILTFAIDAVLTLSDW